VESLERVNAAKPTIEMAKSGENALAMEGLDLALPDGRKLLEGLSTRIQQGDRLLVSGPSGSGKTTLFRAFAGLWPFGKGRVQQPADGRALFLPQRPYLPIGTLRQTLAYPATVENFTDADMQAALGEVGLPQLQSRLDEKANWSMALSIGEQQRVAVVRALLLKPDWLYLDEATSALDGDNETRMYQLLAERLPHATILSIAHRPEVAKYHHRRLAIDPKARTATLAPLAAE
jgi:putative ATP-binding cassette transporter